MKTKSFLLLVLIMVLVLTGCVRSAATSPATTPTAAGDFPVPGTDTSMGLFETIVAQTDQVKGGDGLSPEVTETLPPAPAATATPSAPDATETEPAEVEPSPPPQPTVPPEDIPEIEVPSTYTMREGEHVFCLARRFNINPSQLLSANGLGVNSLLYPGQQLTIPQSADDYPGERSLVEHPDTYTVQQGDTLGDIACAYGDVSPEQIIIANNLDEDAELTVGQTLQIP